MENYITGDLEVLDLIVLRHYGSTDMLVPVMDANPGLAKHGPILPSRLEILLPVQEEERVSSGTIRLWGSE